MKLLPALFTLLFLLFGGHAAKSSTTAEFWTKNPVKPGELFSELRNNPNLEKYQDGEAFAWHSAGGGAFVDGYMVWGGTEWLDYGIEYYNFLLDHMRVAPDGYKGLLGRNFRNDLWSDEEVSDALALGPLLRFSELVLKDESLRSKYEEVANRYVEHARKHVIEKLDARGLWHEIGEYGDYIFGKQYVDPAKPNQWITDEKDYTGGMSQKFNIANKLGLVNLYLYRITGEEVFRSKAEKLFYRLKSNFQLIDNHYTWHYWVPFWEEDVLFEENRLIHWTNVHPYRPGYQAEEVHQIIEAYHNGIVFTRTDIERIRNTNIEIMWNGDLNNPRFINSNGRKPEVTRGSEEFMKSHSGSGASNKGILWSALVDFDETARLLYERTLANPKSASAKVRAAYYYTQVKPVPPNYERHFGDRMKVAEKEIPFGTSRELVLATVIPYVIEKGTDSVLLAKAVSSGPLSIDLYSADGKDLIRNLYSGDIIGNDDGQKGFRMVKWDGTDPLGELQLEGDYLVRWNFTDGYRLYGIKILESKEIQPDR